MKQSAIFLLILSFFFAAFSQSPLRDINSIGEERSGDPSNLIEFKDGFLFRGFSIETGAELWWADSSSGSQRLVKDIFPGPYSSWFYNELNKKAMIEDTLFFLVHDGTWGKQVWRTDGTDAGTYRITQMDLSRGAHSLISYQEEIYLIQQKGSLAELWKINPQSQQVRLVKADIPTRHTLQDLQVAEDLIFFSTDSLAVDSSKTYVWLWRSDGTEAGTFPLIKNVKAPGSASSDYALSHYIPYKDHLYFVAHQFQHSYLFKTDGTISGTNRASLLFPGPGTSEHGSAIISKGSLFLSFDNHNTIEEFHLYKSLGLPGDANKVFELTGNTRYAHSNLKEVGDWIYFTAPDGTGTSISRFNSLTNETELIAPITQIFGVSEQDNPLILKQNQSGVLGIIIPRLARTGITNRTYLWRTDGTRAGTYPISLIKTFGPEPITIGNYFYFNYESPIAGFEIFQSDGTSAGTRLLHNIDASISSINYFNYVNPYYPHARNPRHFTLNDFFYFYADDGTHGGELWRTDGTPGGTTLFKDISLVGSSFISDPTKYKGEVFFNAEQRYDEELWRTDGTLAGTQLIRVSQSSVPGPEDPDIFTQMGDYLYFSSDFAKELWRTDGTRTGTQRVSYMKLPTVPYPRQIEFMEKMNKELYLATRNYYGLWKSNGEIGNLSLIYDSLTIKSPFTVLGDHLIFTACYGGEFGEDEIWVSDGTQAGTQMLKDIYPGKRPLDLITGPFITSVVQNSVLFFQHDSIHGLELWKTDGTTAGTRLVKDISPGVNSGIGRIMEYEIFKGKLYFSAHNGIDGKELWTSDGTEAGTQMAFDIVPGPEGSIPQDFNVLDSTLYFSAYQHSTGMELWKTDGDTIERLTDINPGARNSNPETLAILNNKLIFSAIDGQIGREIWVLDFITGLTQRLGEKYVVHTYPNPTQNILHIEVEEMPMGEFNLEMLSTDGKIVLQENISNHSQTFVREISLAGLARGVYLLRIRSEDTLIYKKVIKE